MDPLEHMALGALAGLSAFFLLVSVISYRRSGVRRLLFLSYALSAHFAATVSVAAYAQVTDALDSSVFVTIVLVDIVALAAILIPGGMGGRPRG